MASCTKKSKCESESESKSKPNWLELPIDLTKNILQRLDTIDIVTSARNVCPLWWNIFKDPLMWRTIRICHMQHIPLIDICCFETVCRSAIDLSCGHLEDFDLELLGCDELLEYIAPRASTLRRLRLFYCHDVSNKCLIEFVTKFSLLKKLVISFNDKFQKDSFEVINRCCPLLKSLDFVRPIVLYIKRNDLVFAIAKAMPGLHHLTFAGIVINNAALVTILDGCSMLQSLDLQLCICHRLSQSLEKRCLEQIKDLRFPLHLLPDIFDEDDAAYFHDHTTGSTRIVFY